ncbi:hypothetical protein [Phyllobacterium salinisoli]|uniref:hypothetical protein n=1 Tax=Phyllobacterium salinisoli TaxID=1899321 RepID=UPI001357166E|nr:hypothetical protein [Phyllobacterium salinisoli]
MIARTRDTAALLLRMALFTAVIIGPIGLFTAVQAVKAPGINGVGLVLFVSLQRVG